MHRTGLMLLLNMSVCQSAHDVSDLMLQVAQFWDDIDSSFPYLRQKPHFMAIGRREAELLGGCGVDDKMYTKASTVLGSRSLCSATVMRPLQRKCFISCSLHAVMAHGSWGDRP